MPCARQTGRIIIMLGLEQQLIWNARQKQEEKRWTCVQCAFKNRLNTGLGNPVQMQPSTSQDLLLKILHSFPALLCLLAPFWSNKHQTQLQSLTSSLRCTCSPAEVNFVAEKQVIVLKRPRAPTVPLHAGAKSARCWFTAEAVVLCCAPRWCMHCTVHGGAASQSSHHISTDQVGQAKLLVLKAAWFWSDCFLLCDSYLLT